ncbi:MAG: DUF4062 domain-containing protein [Desulfoprunum sp.]|nr:DUF4062 domain-containing protein [Desulfoprunum sp.]
MARQEHVLSVFVASPGDVEAERGKLEDVIRELNVTWSRELGVRLDLVRWETHAYPGMGADAQDVINAQIPDDYDLFVGIMWCRYGTPTGRAGSGTVEEFDRAKARYDSDADAVQLMIYFKDEAIPPSRLDPEQLTKVNAFRDSLGDDGGLYWQFNGIEQFEKLIRLHLTRQVQAWKKRTDNTDAVDADVEKQALALRENDDDEGILDLMEVFEDKFAELTEISQRIATATEELGQKMNDRTAEMEGLPKDPQGNANRKDAKRLIAKAASDMTQYTARIEAELPLFRDAMNTGMNSFIKAATMSVDLNSYDDNVQQAKEGLEAVASLRGALATSRESMSEFRTTMAALPRMTTDLNKAKRGATSAVDSLLTEFVNGEVLLTESEKVIRDLLGESENST